MLLYHMSLCYCRSFSSNPKYLYEHLTLKPSSGLFHAYLNVHMFILGTSHLIRNLPTASLLSPNTLYEYQIMCQLTVLQRICCNQVIIPPSKPCGRSASNNCYAVTTRRSHLASPCNDCKRYLFGGCIEIDPEMERSQKKGSLNPKHTQRLEWALQELLSNATSISLKWNFILQIDSPTTEEGVTALEKRMEEFPDMVDAAILKAKRDARRGKDLPNLLGQLSLSDGTQAEGGVGALFDGRLVMSSVASLAGGPQDDELIAALQRLSLI